MCSIIPYYTYYLSTCIIKLFVVKQWVDENLLFNFQIYFLALPTLVVFNFFVYCKILTAGFEVINGKLKNIMRPDFEDLENINHYGPKGETLVHVLSSIYCWQNLIHWYSSYVMEKIICHPPMLFSAQYCEYSLKSVSSFLYYSRKQNYTPV